MSEALPTLMASAMRTTAIIYSGDISTEFSSAMVTQEGVIYLCARLAKNSVHISCVFQMHWCQSNADPN